MKPNITRATQCTKKETTFHFETNSTNYITPIPFRISQITPKGNKFELHRKETKTATFDKLQLISPQCSKIHQEHRTKENQEIRANKDRED